METDTIFYLCPKCFDTFVLEPVRHPHGVLRIDIALLNVEARRPLMDSQGNLHSCAPRWFLEATGMISRRPAPGAAAASRS